MSAEYTIRKATSSDLDVIVAYTVQETTETEGGAPPLEALQRGVQAGLDGSAAVTYWVAEDSRGAAVGSISVVKEWSNFRGGYYWWIQSLYISLDHRGKGLVDQLLDFVARVARSEGALDLRLYVLQSNLRAIAAYKRCGFEVSPYLILHRKLMED